MRAAQWSLSLTVALACVNATSAGIGIFSRKAKVDPAEQVPTLILQLKTDGDEAKRTTAAEELRSYDPKAYPEVIAALADALLKDASSAVRTEAASTLAKLRPISQQAGYALEQAAANDPSIRVRMAARQSLWQYNLLGYRSSKPATDTAPSATPPSAPQAKTHTSSKIPSRSKESPEPPLADAVPLPAPTIAPPRPLPPPIKATPIKPTGKQGSEPQGPSLGNPNN